MLGRLFALLVLLVVVAASWAYLAATGVLGELQPQRAISQSPRLPALDRPDHSVRNERQILFGDLHVHSTFSFDAYNLSLPMLQGEGAHPPADACDFARYCSALDFWSINDHAEGLTPAQWSRTKDLVRECNTVAGDAKNPDMVTFLGWEWTQIGETAEAHYGHKNIVLKDIAEQQVPTRPISSREQLFPSGRNPYGLLMRLLFIVTSTGSESRQPYYDFARFLQDREDLISCDKGVPVRELPADCQESAATPTELFGKLDDWSFPYLVIPHGNSWGFYTPPLTRWDKQLAAHTEPDRHEPLIEVFSGHGNIEQYKSWRAVGIDENGQSFCPEPRSDFLPACWQAGEIIRKRCLADRESLNECDQRAVSARANHLAGRDSGHWTVPGSELEDWLDAGQCRDCYMPAYNHRPTASMQYGLAIRDFSDPTKAPKRFRWGIIGSSDIHSARPGSGYKEILRRSMSDGRMANLGPPPAITQRDLEAFSLTPKEAGLFGPYFERFSSFLGTGGLVAVHSAGRDRDSIFTALQDKQVYGTSGDRILLWFDLLESSLGPSAVMGRSVSRSENPEFEVSAMGDWQQQPGCPDNGGGLGAQRLQQLCAGECYNPGDARKRIERIEVVRIRPQLSANEAVDPLIEDPWKIIPCDDQGQGCRVRFSDPDFAQGQRDSLYYVRAVQEPTQTINGENLRCERDQSGECIAIKPCRGRSELDLEDECLSSVGERAWSSPIFVDYEPRG
ncbi:MAG: DUF3604 domain-containing protein [Halioglobus sp.]